MSELQKTKQLEKKSVCVEEISAKNPANATGSNTISQASGSGSVLAIVS